jgi:transposase InsO family protein
VPAAQLAARHAAIFAIRREDEDGLTQAIIQLASQYGRYGYRPITALLKRAGWRVGKDRVERIWRREGLKRTAKAEATRTPLAQRCLVRAR